MNFRYEPESKPLEGYTIKRAIQRGGFGEVYYALSDGGKEVALKLLQANADVELRGIAQCLNLKHSNLLSIFDVKESAAGEQFVIMEYVAGRTLGEVIADKPDGINHEFVEEIVSQIAAGTEYLHERGIVHRDLKPANIYLEGGVIKIGDVGLAKFISESRRSAQTQSVGTVYYMAPEIAHGRYGKEVDVYAIGVMLYEMLTGNVPFDGESTGEILMKQLSAEPDLSTLPHAIRPVLERALAKDPEKRTSSASQLAQEFSAALHGSAVPVPPPIPVAVHASYQDQPVRGKRLNAAGDREQAEMYNAKQRHWQEKADWFSRPGNWWVLAAGILAIIIFSPLIAGIGIPLVVLASPLLILLAFAAGSFGLVKWAIKVFSGDEPNIRVHNRGVKLNSRYVRYESAESERQLGMLDRVAESTGSMAVAAFCSAAIAFALFATKTALDTPTEATLFAIVTALGAWAAILPAKIWEGRGGDGFVRRVVTGLLGAVVGVAAFGVDDSLMVDLPVRGVMDPVATQLASQTVVPISLSYGDASRLIGYVVFFAVLMMVRRWWFHVDSYRPHRIRVTSVFWTAAAAWLLSMTTHFPAEWAVLWAIAMSTTAQLAAVWVRPDQRTAQKI